jgi:hypothetical protein
METSGDATILDEISRAFIPPCILLSKDCLSRTRHLLEQAGTLDAYLISLYRRILEFARALREQLRQLVDLLSASAISRR